MHLTLKMSQLPAADSHCTHAGRLPRLSDKVLPLGPTAAHSNVDELVSAPHRVDASRAARDLHIRPVREPEQWPSHKIAHGVDCSGARASSAVQARARSLQPIAASVYRQGRMTEIIDPDKKSE